MSGTTDGADFFDRIEQLAEGDPALQRNAAAVRAASALSVVADTAAGEAMECPTPCDDECDAACHEVHQPRRKRQHQPEECFAARSGGAQDDGLRGRIEALIAFYDRHEYSSLEVDDLRRALAGPDDARQDGAR